jgi:hypothetical protein
VIAPDLIDYLQINKMRIRFSEDERDHYITKGEICRIRKDVQRANIQFDPNDAQSTRHWVNTLQSEGQFAYYKDKRDPPPQKDQISQATCSSYVFKLNFKKTHTIALGMHSLASTQLIMSLNTKGFYCLH